MSLKVPTSKCETISSSSIHSQKTGRFFEAEALNRELQEYKQLLNSYKDENNMLKVKIRRLEESLRKKNKVVDTHYLGPHNKLLFKEAVSQYTYKIDALEHENKEFKDAIFKKDHTIRQLQKKISSYAAYKKPNKKKHNPELLQSTTIEIPSAKTENNGSDTGRSTQQSDVQTTISSFTLTPHEEIEKLHSGFKDIINEVGKLKQSINEINHQNPQIVNSNGPINDATLQKEMRELSRNEQIAIKALPTSMRKPNSAPQGRHGNETPRRRTPNAFTRIQATKKSYGAKGNNKKQEGNPFAIRTLSKTSLLDETDMKLYIDEIIRDMNRTNFK